MIFLSLTFAAIVCGCRGSQTSDDDDPFLALESKSTGTFDSENDRQGRLVNFNPFQLFQLASRRTSQFVPNAPFRNLYQSESAVAPGYADARPPQPPRAAFHQWQNNKDIRNNFQEKPFGIPHNYNQPIDLGLHKRPPKPQGNFASPYSPTTFTLLDRPAPMQSGFTPIINGQRSQVPLASNKLIHLIKLPHQTPLTLNQPSSLQYLTSSSSAKYSKPVSHKQPAAPLITVPVEQLANARNSTFFTSKNKNGLPQASSSTSFYIPSSYNVSSSISSAVRVNSNGKPVHSLKNSSSQIREQKISPQKASDFNCDGSQDLGWCDLGNTYPKNLVQNLMEQCKDVIDSMYVEIPHNFEKLSDLSGFRAELDNASSREVRERGNHESWSWAAYFHQGSLCEAERGFLRPEAAKDSKGVWTVVIQDERVRQRVPIEMCRNTNSSCKKMLDCGLKSQCLQKYNYHLLLSLDPSDLQECPSMRLYRFPSACVCHVE